MRRNFQNFSLLIAIGIVLFLTWAGCARQAPRQIPQDDIHSRAERVFNDLGAAEGDMAARLTLESENSQTANPAADDNAHEYAVPLETGRRPDWVDGAGRPYPFTHYLTGVGYGPDRQAAEDMARSEIAKIFYSDIQSSNRIYQEILERTAGGKSTSEGRINFAEITRVTTHKILSGVRITRVYRDRGSQPEFYALAVLDRFQSRAVLRQKIQELDVDMQQLLSEFRGQPDPLSQVKLLWAGMRKHALRQAYNAELRIVDPSAQGVAPVINATDIKTRLNNVLLKDFLIALSVAGPGAEQVRQALSEALNQQGFAVTEEIGKASIVARGMIEINPLPPSSSGWQFVRWQAYFDLVDRNGGSVFGSVHKSGKTGHLTLAHAEDRAVSNMRKALAVEISEDLSRYITTQGN